MRYLRVFQFSLLLVFLLLAFPAIIPAQTASISATSFYEDKAFHYDISEKDVEDTPSWNPSDESMPLSPRSAIEIGRTNLARFVTKGLDLFDVQEIQMTRFPLDKWLFVIHFDCWGLKCGEDGHAGFTIYVKMDGTIVEPRVSLEPTVRSPILFEDPSDR